MGLQALHLLDRRNPLSETLDRDFSRSCQRGKAVVRAVAETIDRAQEGTAYSYVMGGIGGARRIAVVRLLAVGCNGRLVRRPWRRDPEAVATESGLLSPRWPLGPEIRGDRCGGSVPWTAGSTTTWWCVERGVVG